MAERQNTVVLPAPHAGEGFGDYLYRTQRLNGALEAGGGDFLLEEAALHYRAAHANHEVTREVNDRVTFYTGTREALLSSGVVQEAWLPGAPGGPLGSKTTRLPDGGKVLVRTLVGGRLTVARHLAKTNGAFERFMAAAINSAT